MKTRKPTTRSETIARLQAKPTLLTLPGELRNRIYSLAVVPQEDVDVRIVYWRKDALNAYWRILPGRPVLAFTCKSMQRDVLSIYFAAATFRIALRFPSSPQAEVKRLRILAEYLGGDADYIQRLRFKIDHRIHAGHQLKEWEACISADRDQDGNASFTCLGNRMYQYTLPRAPASLFCTCELQSKWAASAHQGEGGARLLGLAIDAALDNFAHANVTTCNTCELSKLVIIQRAS